MSVFAEALAEAQGIDLAFDNYREDIRLGHKKIFLLCGHLPQGGGPGGRGALYSTR